PRRMGAGEAAAGLVAPLIARHRIDIDENVFGDEIRELLVAVVTQEQRLASVPDKDDRVMRNIALAHDALLRAEFRRPPPAGGFGSGTNCYFVITSRRRKICAGANQGPAVGRPAAACGQATFLTDRQLHASASGVLGQLVGYVERRRVGRDAHLRADAEDVDWRAGLHERLDAPLVEPAARDDLEPSEAC